MEVDQIFNHVDRALSRLIQQYRKSEVLRALVSSLVLPMQSIEGTLFDLKNFRSVDSAEGIQLDLIGIIVGQVREPGQSDDDYRTRIKTRIIQNISRGEPESSIAVFKRLTMSALVLFSEDYPGGVELQGDADISDQNWANLLYEQCELVLPAGVRLNAIIQFDPDEPLAMAGNLFGSGLGDADDLAVGGKIAELKLNLNVEFALGDLDPLENDATGGGLGATQDPLVGGFLIT